MTLTDFPVGNFGGPGRLLLDACSNCPLASVTLEDGIESALINEIPEVVKVVNED